MEIIVPAAGLSTRFPNMRPKYTLNDFSGTMMLRRAVEPFLGKHNITIGVLQKHEDQYGVCNYIKKEFGNDVNVVLLEKETAGPADTVYQIIKSLSFDYDTEFLIKDCDSFFDHEYTEGNYVCVSNIADHDVLKKLSSKSFIIVNDQDIITDIVEKEVVSSKFCVGAYKFESIKLFCEHFEKLKDSNIKEIFVSHVIGSCLQDKNIFLANTVKNLVDVGTATDWFEYNDLSVIFCDIDGTLVKAQSKGRYTDPVVPLKNNVDVMLAEQQRGSQIIFTTVRDSKYDHITRAMLESLGFKNIHLVSGILNTKRVLINDYNEANPYPRAVAINIKRDDDNLKDFLKIN